MKLQKTDWGCIEWLKKEDNRYSQAVMNAGTVMLEKGKHQPPHVHYEEQVIYILEGYGRSLIDGKEADLAPGVYLHMPAGIIHEIYNTGDTPLKHLLISNPANLDEETFLPQAGKEPRELNSVESAKLLYIAVEAIRTQFLETMHYAYAIFDRKGNLVSKSKYFPTFCMQHCSPSLSYGACPCMIPKRAEDMEKERTDSCPYGIDVYAIGLYYQKSCLGYIQGGYVRQSREVTKEIYGLYDTPDSTVVGIKNLLYKIAKAVRNVCEFNQFRQELTEKELEISNTRESQQLLMKNLKDTEYAMTDLKINNHFLFNTLNSMASMALETGAVSLYQSIIDLSKLFHYTLRNQDSMVTLEREYEYLRAYLQLQKLRYAESLSVEYEIEPEALQSCVPFNFLQPVTENAFIHGFTAAEEKKLRICIRRIMNQIDIEICNSGHLLNEQECYAINMGMKSNTAHGLSMIYHKLEAVYGERFSMEISPDMPYGTRFRLILPVGEGDRSEYGKNSYL